MADPLPLVVELEYVAVPFDPPTWNDITETDDVYSRDPITISRGRKNEAEQVDPSSCSVTLNNRTGRYSSRNPDSDLFGKIGRNTPLRVRVGDPTGYLLEPTPESVAIVRDSSGTSITGDMDLRIDIEPDTWIGGTELASKYFTSGDERSWAWWIEETGVVTFRWSPDGTFGSVIDAVSTDTRPVTFPRLQLRVVFDWDNGAGGHDVTFYWAEPGGPWNQLGAVITGSGTTQIADTTADTYVGDVPLITNEPTGIVGRVYSFRMFAATNETDERVALDFSTFDGGQGPFTDPHGELVDLDGLATNIRDDIRFVGEVSEWPPRWAKGHGDVWTPIEAAGITRRLVQGSDALNSAIFRATMALDPAPDAYWPCEDGSNATAAASPTPGIEPMSVRGDLPPPDFANYDGFGGSAPLLRFGESALQGRVRSADTGELQVRFLTRIPSGSSDNRILCSVKTTGTIQEWRLAYRTGTNGAIRILAFDQDEANVIDFLFSLGGIDDKDLRLSLEMTQNGADIDWGIVSLEAGSSVGVVNSGTITGHTFGRCERVAFNPSTLLEDVILGHVTVTTAITSIFDIHRELTGFDGEAAGVRLQRLAAEEGVPLRMLGEPNDTAAMGPQRPAALITLLREAGDAGGGVLFEPRDMLGLAYKPRELIFNPETKLALNYAAGDVFEIEPTEDDEGLRNDVTVKQPAGSSARHEVETGPLSVQAPPDGVGRYDAEVERNLGSTERLVDHAAWLAHLGTVDEQRYPQLGVQIGPDNLPDGSELAADARALDVGERLTVSDMPDWQPPGDVDQLAQGFGEELDTHLHTIRFNCTPASPWQVGLLGDEVLGRLDSAGSELTVDMRDALNANTGFESGIQGWGNVNSTLTHSTERAFKGSGSARLVPDGSSGAAVAQTLLAESPAVIEGLPHQVSGWVWSPTGYDAVRVFVTWYDNTDTPITTVFGPLTDLPVERWTFLSLVDVAPIGAVKGQLRFREQNTPSSADVLYIDEALLIEAGLPITTTSGPVWTTDPAEFPFDVDVAGELMTVTSIAATGFPEDQDATVVRAVNGVHKFHVGGVDVRLANPMILSL